MQDAYVSETGTGIGDWKLIGYKMNSTNNFQYFEGTYENGDQTGASVLLSAGKATAWQAKNVGALNDCKAGGSWTINIDKNTSSGGNATYSTVVSSTDCDVLNASFGKLATGTATVN